MSFRDSFRPGAFRGAAFLTETSDYAGGRRGETHEYPERDLPWRQDLGRKARVFGLECFVIGPDYFTARDALIKALEEKGAGLLIHPFHGEHRVSVDDFTCQESTAEGGIARFSIDFTEAGAPEAAQAGPAGQRAVDPALHAKTVALLKANDERANFCSTFSTSGLPGPSVGGAIGNLGKFSTSSLNAGRLLGGAGKALRSFESGIALFDQVSSLVTSPIRIADAVQAMVSRVRGLGSVPLLRLRALRRMFDDARDYPEVIGATPVRVRERENRDALERFVSVIVAAEAVQEAAQVNFVSRDDATGLRDSFAAQLDVAIVRASDQGWDATAQRLDALRLAMIRDTSARGTRLDPLQSFTPFETEPVLVIANRLYGARGIEARADAIVSRNRIVHPGFAFGAVPLELVAPGVADG